MIRMPFRPPVDYYCDSVAPIDEQICALLAKRKELSENNPGFPPLELISGWCQQYQLNEDIVRSIFGILSRERDCFPMVEPASLLKFVSVLKSVEIDGILYTVTHMKQYKNASVVYIESEAKNSEPNVPFEHASFELFISKEYLCRPNGGFGQNKGMQHSFVVTPPLPDDVADVEFCLTVKPKQYVPRSQVVALKELSVTIK